MTTLSIRASDSDRHQVVELLDAAYAEGRITFDEHEQRTAAALKARTFDDLSGLTADLVPARPPGPAIAMVDATSVSADADLVRAVVASCKRVGAWRVRPLTHVNAFVGSVELDLTETTFEAPVVVFDCSVFLGDITIRVPTGTRVVNEVSAIIGDQSVKRVGEPDPSLPTVVVSGTAVLGEVKVRGPRKVPFWKRHVA